MAALVVVSPPQASAARRTGTRITIFPGGATPAMLRAGTPFWIGYGFVAHPAEPTRGLSPDTRFELEVDGDRVALVTEQDKDGELTVSKTDVAEFPPGLPEGWHRFVGRWYDDGALVLASDKTIEFVE